MAHQYHHHELLDDDELRMSLDDDMRALEALDDADVDMDGLDQHDDQHGDVFRPSAMLDRRMEEEFGGAFYSTCFQASELVEKDLDGGFVDIEQMLLSESEEFLTAHFANTSDELLHAQLLHGDSEQMNQQQQQRMIRAELTARHFLHAQSNGDSTTTDQQQRLVLLKQAIASSPLSSSSIFNMPPKYFEGGGTSSPQKRRAHRRTFGERTQPFAFGNSNAFAYKQEDQVTQAAVGGYSYHQHTSTREATVSDENSPPSPPTPSATPANEVRIKEEIVLDTGVTQSHTVALEMSESMDEGDQDDEQNTAAMALDSRAQTPVTLSLFTGFRSITDDDHHQHDKQNVHEEEALRTTFRTPLRRSLSSPAPSSQAAEQQFTPQQQQLSGGDYTSRSMSPADAFEKVAVVVQVVKDSPGRVDKFEWRIGSTRQQQNDETKAKKRPNLSTQLGTADASHDNDQSFAEAQDASESSSAALPPRYFRGVTSSPQKRRVHSTTFGSFARSFSFTGSAPPSDL